MSDRNNWANGLNECIDSFVHWFYEFFGYDDDCEYISAGPPNEKIDIEIQISVKVKRK